jgi:hypothetical protein
MQNEAARYQYCEQLNHSGEVLSLSNYILILMLYLDNYECHGHPLVGPFCFFDIPTNFGKNVLQRLYDNITMGL